MRAWQIAMVLTLALALGACAQRDDSDGSDGVAAAGATEEATAGSGAPVVRSAPSAACQAANPADSCRELTLPETAGLPRAFQVRRPEGAGDRPPLLILLHGIGAYAELQANYMAVRDLADARGWVLALPDGFALGGDFRFWNTSRGCLFGEAAQEFLGKEVSDTLCGFLGSYNDADYVAALIDELVALEGVDPDRVYLLGHSNGGFLSHATACSHADKVSGIVAFAGQLDSVADCAPSGDVRVMHIHGTGDETVPYQAGAEVSPAVVSFLLSKLYATLGIESDPPTLPAGAGGAARPTPEESIAFWAANNGCSPDRSLASSGRLTLADSVYEPAAGPERDGEVYAYGGCRADTRMVLVPDGGHTPLFDIPAFHALVGGFLAGE